MIPKIAYTSWKTKDVINDEHPLIQLGIQNFVNLNPEWSLEISTDEEVDYYLKSYLHTEDYTLISNKHIVEKLDLWRLIKIYNEGGMYVDLDRLCNKNISEWFDEATKWILPVCNYNDFSHDIMISEKHNPVYLKAIEINLHLRKNNCTRIFTLGPETYMRAITHFFLKEPLNINPGKEIFLKIIDLIKSTTFIKTFVEVPPLDTILYRNSGQDINHEALKRDFYAKEGIKHWTGNW